MSYEFRRPIFNFSGVLTAAISPTDVTLTSSAFVNLPVDYSTATPGLYLPLVLADDAAGKSEIVWVTGHSSGSSSVTVIRGAEGSTPQAFAAGNVVRCSATTWDLGPITVATRSGLPASPYGGMRVLILDEAQVVTYSAVVRKWTGDPKRKHRWLTSSASLAHNIDYVPFGLALYLSTGDIATIGSGVVLLNKPGPWFLSWTSYTDHNSSGWISAWLDWPNGALQDPVEQQVHRAATGFAGSGQIRTRISWEGYVTPAQAAAGLTPKLRQVNAAGTAITGMSASFVAEFLG